MLGRARVKRICQAALGALIDPKKAAYDLVKDETGELFDRWFPDTSTPQQRLLKAVLRDVSKAYPDQALSEHLTEKAQALLAMHGLSREELAGPGIRLDAQRAVERVCARGLKTAPPGLHEADRSFDGGLPPIEIEASIEQPLRQLLWSFYDSLIKNLDEELQVAIFGRTLDLLEGIDRKLDSLTRPTEGPGPPFTIPQPVADFAGYATEVAAVRDALKEGSASISAVQGIGGVGKTELARKVAMEMRADFPDGQIMVDMLGTTQPRDARDAMTDVLKALGAEDIEPATLAAEYHSRLAGKRVLILLDNVASGAGLQDLVPPHPAALLVTSRTRFAMAGVVPVVLEKLSREAAKALLAGMVPGLEDATLDALARLCADLPLALRVAGSYLQSTGGSATSYLNALEQRRLRHLAQNAGDMNRPDLDPLIVLGHSLDRLAEDDAALARAFVLLGVFPADFDLQGAAFVLDAEPDATERLLELLVLRGLLQRPSDGRYRLHDLLRDLANAKAEPAGREAAAARHRGYYLALLQDCEQEYFVRRNEVRAALAAFETEQTNIDFAAQCAIEAGDLETAASGYGRIGSLARELGRREDALGATEEAVGLYRRLARDRPDAFDPDLAASLNNLGLWLHALGRREDALSATEEAVAIRRRLTQDRPDAFNPHLARSLNNLGMMLNALGRREDALSATEEAVDLYRRLAQDRPDAFNPDLAASVDNLGAMLDAVGRREDALGATEEAVAIRRRLARDRPDAFNPDLASSLNNLGIRFDAVGRREDALGATEEAVAIRRRLARDRPDAFDPDLAMSLSNLGIRLDALGRREDALSATEEAVGLYQRLAQDRPDAFNPDLATSLNNLGNRLNTLGRREDALGATEEAVTIRRRLARDRPDAFDPDLATSLNNLGNRLNTLGRREDALGATEEAVDLYRRLARDRPDAFNPVLATSLYNLSLRLDGLQRAEEGHASNIEAIELLRPTFLQLPQAVAHWMAPMCRQYVERCQKLGVEPDAALLGPIDAVLERLKAESG